MNEFEKKCKLEKNDKFGRHLVAAIEIKPGETVLLDSPFLILPQMGERRCANCLKITNAGFCSLCKVFILCEDCQSHNSYDCEFFASLWKNQQQQSENQINLADLQNYYNDICILLRCLLLRENQENCKNFDRFLELESHFDERRDTEVWKELNDRVVEPLIKSGLPSLLRKDSKNNIIDADFLQRILGIIDVNAFEIRATDEGSLRAIFLRGSLLSHDCVANVAVAVDDNYQMKVYANRDIAKDEPLTHCYTNVMLGTEERRISLKIGKYFHCTCSRCEDPTESESHLSTLLCIPCGHRDEDGFVVKSKDEAKWQCLRCDHIMPTKNVIAVLERAKEEIFHAQGDLYRYELLLNKLGQFLHKNHYLMIDLKQNVAAILRSIIANPARKPGRKVYQRKVRLCQDILMALYHIQPGSISRMRAIALYELCSAQAELYRLLFHEKELPREELKEQLTQSEAMLRESLRMLLYEPTESPEGRLARSMMKELKDLQNDIKLLDSPIEETI